jgi:hypothetical protein
VQLFSPGAFVCEAEGPLAEARTVSCPPKHLEKPSKPIKTASEIAKYLTTDVEVLEVFMKLILPMVDLTDI